MVSDDTTIVMNEVGTSAVRLTLSELDDHDVTVVFEAVGGTVPIVDLAAEAMKDANIDL